MTMEPYAHVFPVNSAEIRFLKGSIPMGFLTKLFGTNMAKEIKRLDPIVRKIEVLEEEYKGYTDAQLQAKTPELKERYKNGETLDDLLPELPPSPYLIRKEKKVQRIRHKKPRTT